MIIQDQSAQVVLVFLYRSNFKIVIQDAEGNRYVLL